jgi:hypothetical protein
VTATYAGADSTSYANAFTNAHCRQSSAYSLIRSASGRKIALGPQGGIADVKSQVAVLTLDNDFINEADVLAAYEVANRVSKI